MLTIRSEQMSVLGTVPFEARMRAHLGTHFPDVCRQLGEDETQRRIRDGIAEASQFGITDQRGVCLYLSVSMALGPDFARDPAMVWAREVLAGPATQQGVNKALHLSRLAVEHLFFDRA